MRDMNVMGTSLFVAMLAGVGESCPSSGCTQGGDLASDGTIVAQVAAEEPDTAAKIVQPITLTCSKPPGKRCTQGAMPRNNDSDNLLKNKMSPIRTNKGRVTNSSAFRRDHTSWARMR